MGEAVMISEGEGAGQCLLPRMGLRVLLVEADDCTRQIISALLRKCSYKVAAVPDGLKAWETLRESSHNIDLVLTEVDLPSISGYALLTLIVEHDMCKNIPVIMMSSQDSISMVLKCMVKGAADFLIKPIRKNELRNLWQHVWRRKIQGAGSCPQNKALENPKSVHVSENEIASNYSSDNQPSAQTGNEKASGAQVLEHEECVEMVDRSVNPNRKSIDNMTSSGMGTSSGIEPYSSVDISSDEDSLYAVARAMVAEVEQECHRKNTCKHDEVYSASCTEAFDYIGKFEDFLGQSYDSNAKSNVGSRLGLCMKTFDPGCSNDEWSGEQNMISHSKASAFSKYENKITLQHPYCTREHGGSLTEYQQNTSTLTFSTSEVQITEPFGDSRVHSDDNAAETVNGKLITAEKARCDSAVCESSDLGSGVTNKLSSSPSGSNSNEAIESSLPVSSPGRALVSESVNNGSLLQDKTRAENHNTSQREAALLKFRLKRKDRCFDKKVRYQSRKRLAEQRPRVKGQFVRQLKNENQPEGQR